MAEEMYVIVGNYGNGTIAIVQWAREQGLENVFVINVETGWAAERWQQQVALGKSLVQTYGFAAVTLKSTISFEQLMQQRGEFPTAKFQWCASTLKGLALLNWLDEFDPKGEAIILLGKTRFSSRINRLLPEHIEESEYYEDRHLWHPLIHETEDSFRELVVRAGFPLLPHRSLECDPCINSTAYDFQQLKPEDVAKTQALENHVGGYLCQQQSITDCIKQAHGSESKGNPDYLEAFDKGCSSSFGCGE